jgi:hypothetical protein
VWLRSMCAPRCNAVYSYVPVYMPSRNWWRVPNDAVDSLLSQEEVKALRDCSSSIPYTAVSVVAARCQHCSLCLPPNLLCSSPCPACRAALPRTSPRPPTAGGPTPPAPPTAAGAAAPPAPQATATGGAAPAGAGTRGAAATGSGQGAGAGAGGAAGAGPAGATAGTGGTAGGGGGTANV